MELRGFASSLQQDRSGVGLSVPLRGFYLMKKGVNGQK